MPQNQVDSGACGRHVPPADGVGSLKHGPRTHPAHADGRLGYNGADRDGQNGNPEEKVRTKLLTLPPPLKIALLARGQLSPSFVSTGDSGWSLVRFRIGNAAPENFQTLEEVLATLVDES